jgi:hypothetical protein
MAARAISLIDVRQLRSADVVTDDFPEIPYPMT